MKILQVINSLKMGGAEKLVTDIAPLLNKKENITDILLINGSETGLFSTFEHSYEGNIIKLSIGNVYNPLNILRIHKYLQKYDIIHVHLFPSFYWVALSNMLVKSKLVYTEHNTSNKRRGKWFLKPIEKFIYSKYSKIITIADQVHENLKHHIGSDENLTVVNNGVRIDDFKMAKAYVKEKFFEKEDKILIQVSSFSTQKDQKTLIQSLSYLPSNIKLLLVGDGPLRKKMEKLVDELKIRDRVKFLGIRNDVPRLLKTSDIIILSSFHEGLSLSSIEGMATGKPFIASDVPGLTEIVGGYGILFEQGNSKELSSIIKELLTDNELYENVTYKCQERAKEFDLNRMVDGYIQVYKEVCSKN